MEKLKKKNRLFLAYECSSERCVLSRKENPQYRELFEKRVVASLEKHHKNEKGVNYVDFGSGDGFSVVVSLVKFLVQKPKAKMTIHWIDKKYTPFVAAKNRREVDLGTIDPTTTSGWAAYVANKPCKCSKLSGWAWAKYCMVEMVSNNVVHWLRDTFPNAEISLALHESVSSYRQYIKKYNIPAADVVSAIDIEDLRSRKKNAIAAYIELCKETLKDNPEASNCLVIRENITVSNNNNRRPKIVELFPSNKEEDKRKDLKMVRGSDLLAAFEYIENLLCPENVATKMKAIVATT